MVSRFVDKYLPVALLYGLAAYFLLDTKDFTPDALMFPRILAWSLIGLTTLLLLATLLKRVKLPAAKEDRVPRKFAAIFGLSLVYIAAIHFAGFVISSLIYCPLTAVVLGYRKKARAVLVSVLIVGFIYCSFKYVLKVPLPSVEIGGVRI